MKIWPVITTAAAVAALAGCGTAATTAHSTPPAHSASPVSAISPADAGRVCAALNALEYGGSSKASAAVTAERAYHVTAADIARARKIRCPGN